MESKRCRICGKEAPDCCFLQRMGICVSCHIQKEIKHCGGESTEKIKREPR